VWAQTTQSPIAPASPSKEYIRMGGRVITIENGGVGLTVNDSALTLYMH
jgi:hypothetical protein